MNVRRITRSSRALASGTNSLPNLTSTATTTFSNPVNVSEVITLSSNSSPTPIANSASKSTKMSRPKSTPTKSTPTLNSKSKSNLSPPSRQSPTASPNKKRKLAVSPSEPTIIPRLIPQPHTVHLPPTLNFDLATAISHLTTHDPRFHQLFKHLPCRPFVPPYTPIDPFRTLVTSIIGQQVSWMAAKAINKRFREFYGFNDDHEEKAQGFPTPDQVAKSDLISLKAVGLSTRKAEYVIALAEHFVRGQLSTELFRNGTDEDVSRALIAVRGIGQWTVDMFLIFSLRRPDILPVGDLGVQKGLLRWALAAHQSLPTKVKTPKKTPSKTPSKTSSETPIKDKTVDIKLDPTDGEDSDMMKIEKVEPGQSKLDDTVSTPGRTPEKKTESFATPQTPRTEPAALCTPNIPMDSPCTPLRPFPETLGSEQQINEQGANEVLQVSDKTLPPPAPTAFLQPPPPGSDYSENWELNRVAPLVDGLTVEILKQRYNGKKVKGGAYLTPQEMEALTDGWRPYRSLGVIYTWSLAEDVL